MLTVVVHICNPNTRTGGSPQVPGQIKVYSNICLKKQTEKQQQKHRASLEDRMKQEGLRRRKDK